MSDELTMTINNTCSCEDDRGWPVDCGGDCVASDLSILDETVREWVSGHPAPYGYLIEGSGMGWQKRRGTRDWDGREPLHQAIGVDAGWVQRYTFGAHEMTIIQDHHDAIGERYVVRAKRADEAE